MKLVIERIRHKLLLWKSEYITEGTKKSIKRVIRILFFAIIIKLLDIIGIFK